MSGERQRRIKRALAAVFGAAAVLVVLYILRPPCLVRKVFGVLCPSCGTTRMIAALLQWTLPVRGREPLCAVLFAVAAPLGLFWKRAVAKGNRRAF